MAANRALDRAPHKIAGGLLLTAGATILLGIITAEALYTAPYTTRMEISDLGATDKGFILHPSSYIFNATMLVTGAMIILGAYSGRGDTCWQELGVGRRLADSYRDRPRSLPVSEGSPSRRSTASCSPLEAPERTWVRPTPPPRRVARLGIPMPRHATFKMNALLNREVLSGPLGASYGRSHPPVGQVDEQKSCSTGVWWAREELNLRPLPCQQTTGNRCANRRSPRSPPTVDAKGKRSLDVQ
jgi:hypothetical protein